MDSSLPVLVSRLADRHALALLVRAALRNEVAQVELDAGPQRAEAHTLDLHVLGQPPLALLAEPAGNPTNGTFPLRLRPLYRAQAAQLYALLAQENVSIDGPPPDTSPVPTVAEPAPSQKMSAVPAPRTVPMNQQAAMATARQQVIRKIGGAQSEPMVRAAASTDAPRPLPARHPSSVASAPTPPHPVPAGSDPRRTAPSAIWGKDVDKIDPRKTVPGTPWGAQNHPPPRPAAGMPPPAPEPATRPSRQDEPYENEDDPHGADADDPSLSVSVVFEPDDVPPEIKAAAERARANNTAAYAAPPVAPPPHGADADDPSLSVSVVFEPDALPPGITAGLPSPLGDDSPLTESSASDDVPATVADMDGVRAEEPSDPDGLAIEIDVSTDATPEPMEAAVDTPHEESLEPSRPEPVSAALAPLDAESTHEDLVPPPDDFNGFFDDALANFPSAVPPPEESAPPSEEDDELADSMRAIEMMDSVSRVPAALAPPTDDVESGGTQAMLHAPVASIEDFPDIDDIPESRPGEIDADFDINATQFPTDAELQIIDDTASPGPSTMQGLGAALPVPPPDDDDDDDATLIRMPVKGKKPPDPVVRPATRDQREHTPTKETPVGMDSQAMETQVPASQRDQIVAPRRPAASIPDDGDTAAQKKAPLAPPTPEPSDPSDPAIGRKIAEGKYMIESLIGSGAAGAVYRATHRELRRTVAIKLLHPHYQQDPHFMTSFRGEALAASQLDHPNVMRVLDFGQEPDGLVYIVMEFLSGRTLQHRLDEERRLPTERAVEVMIQVCAALSVAHDHGIIHRDIKPDNIMLVPSRNDEGTTFELVKVCDFGIAALQNPRPDEQDMSASEHVIAGTPEYMSPEQARGAPVDARADVYACGICLYELVTGRPPFLGNNAAEILIKQLDETPVKPSEIVKGLDPIIEEVILRAIQKDPRRRHQSAREMRVELKELIDPGDGGSHEDEDELSIVENVAMLDDPASGFPGFFISFSSAVLRFGRFERGHNESTTAMKELQKQLRVSLRGRSELTFARRDSGKATFWVMSGTAEYVELKRLLGSQLMGSFGDPFTAELVKKGIASLTLREGIPDTELHYIIEMLLGPFAHEDLRKELLSKPLRHISVLFAPDVIGHNRKLSWKVGLCAARLARDLRALCNIRGISLKKMRETRDELIGGVARLLTRGEEVKQFLFNADLIDEAVANLRGFSSFQVTPLIVERILHESCAEAATLLLADFDAANLNDQERLRPYINMFAQRLVTERSPKSDAVVGELFRRKIITEEEMPRDLKEQLRAASLADALIRDPSQFLRALDGMRDGAVYEDEIAVLETAMSTLARRAEVTALMAVMNTLSHHAKSAGKPGQRETAALRAMKRMIDAERLAPSANVLLNGPAHHRDAARQLIILAGSVGATALYAAREQTGDPAARPIFIQVMRDLGAAGWALIAQVLPRLEVAGDHELALVEDLLRAMPERADPVLGEAVAKFLPHPALRQTALTAIVPLWGERARKPLVEALEYADEPTRIVALELLRRLHAIDEYVFSVLERFLTMKGSAGEDLRVASAAALADSSTPVRTRAVQMLTKVVEGKRGLVALIRGSDSNEETASVLEAMGRSLLALDRNEGVKALKGRVSRSEGATKQRLAALLQSAG